MKNGHDKIDDVFRDKLNGMESELPESFFEETWSKSQPGSRNIIKGSGINPFYYIIPAVIIIAGTTAIFNPWKTKVSDKPGTEAIQKSNTLYSNENYIAYKSEKISTPSNKTNNNVLIENPDNFSENSYSPVKNNADSKVENISENVNPTEKYKKNAEPVVTQSNPGTVNIRNNNGVSESIVTGENKTVFTGIPAETAINVTRKHENITSRLSSRVTTSMPQFGTSSGINSYTTRNAEYFDPDRWSAEFSFALHYLYSSINSLSYEKSPFAESRNNALEPGFTSYSASLMLNYHRNTFIAGAGFEFNMFTENTDYGITLFNQVTNYELHYNGTPYDYSSGGNYYQIDSTSYWHYTFIADSVIHVADSVLAYETDTNLVNIYDSVAITKFDTADYSKLKAKYSVIEFPLYAGIEINKGRWGYTFSAGIIPGYLIRRTGSLFDGYNEIQLPADIFPMKKFILSGGVKAQFNYYPGTKVMLFAGPELRSLLINPCAKGSGYDQNWLKWGFRLGARYFF